MIIENSGLQNLKSDLAHLDEVAEKLHFVRWQWELYRATYDLKIIDPNDHTEYYLRINARAIEGRLENPYTILQLTDVYMGKVTFPHGLDYEAKIPDAVQKSATQAISELRKALAH